MKQGIQIRPLSPNNISVVPKCWFDGKDSSTFTLDSNYVNNWACKGSLSADVSNTNNDTTRPTYDASTGRVTFTSANSTFLQSAAFGSALIQPNTVFIVFKITGALGANFQFFDGINVFCFMNCTNNKFHIYSGEDLVDGATNANDNIHCALFNGASGEYWINGISVVSGNTGGQGLVGVTLGKRKDNVNYADCEIMEVIVFNSKLPFAENYGIVLGLKEKWGI